MTELRLHLKYDFYFILSYIILFIVELYCIMFYLDDYIYFNTDKKGKEHHTSWYI